MSTPVARRMIEVSGAEALWLLEGATGGRLVYVQRDQAVVRPAEHVVEYGRLVVRVPAPAATLAGAVTVTYQADEIHRGTKRGWSVSAAGPADVITDPDEAAHYLRTLSGWAHGPHDTLIRIRPQSVQGYRLGDAVDANAQSSGSSRPRTR